MDVWFNHKSTGILEFDPKQGTKHFKPWWALVFCDDGIRDLHAWFLKKHGISTEPNKLWGCHISAIKGEEPTNKALWSGSETVEFWYTAQARWDNGRHAWLDVWSPNLSAIRERLGLPAKCFFHLTLGRWR